MSTISASLLKTTKAEMGDKNKGPKTLVPPIEKRPRSPFDQDWRSMKPSWRVGLLEMVDPFGWHNVTSKELQNVRQRLVSLESMTWNEILYESGGKRNHLIKVIDLCGAAQERLAAIGQDDIDSVMSLGRMRVERIFGILDYNVLRLLWWDPQHQICPSAMWHT
jgi:hypothetical protein